MFYINEIITNIMSSVVNVHKQDLIKNGFKSFEEWASDPSSLYIGRDMSNHIKGATGSKWGNPFSVQKYGLSRCLELYEKHIRDTPSLYNNLHELEGKNLGCWCFPSPCHGNILMKLLNETKQKKN